LVTRTITSAEIKSLVASPIVLIPAPGANKIINVISIGIKYLYGGSNVFVAAAAQVIRAYYNVAGAELIGALAQNADLVGTATFYSTIIGSAYTHKTTGLIDNVPVVIVNTTATEISGNAANDNAIYVECAYFISNLS
jgi:hypothetical protein